MAAFAEEHGYGRAEKIFRLKAWASSRPRYWGTAIPAAYSSKDGMLAAPDGDVLDHVQGTRGANVQSGHGAKGRRGHVQVEGQLSRRGRDGPEIWRGHGAAVYVVRCAAGKGFGVERGKHRRLVEVSEPRVPA